jgi:oxygen-independent coproporphyrinogen-3 oxidase
MNATHTTNAISHHLMNLNGNLSPASATLAQDAPPGGWPVPRSMYVHVPFCRQRCGYCNFSVLAGRDELQDRFLDAIDRELISIQRRSDQPISLDTLYLGGGTPTQLTLPRLQRLLTILNQHVCLSSQPEITCEANPEDICDETLELLCAAGVNRLSLGVQSFNDAKLNTLQRSHGGEQAIAAIKLASQYISNLSIDLIFAAPGETLSDWQQDLHTAIELPVQHLSTYSLTYEKGTEFWSRRRRGALQVVSEDTDIAMYESSRRMLREAGFQHYEISSFAKPGSRSRHNSVYWNGHGWYAIGPSAACFVGGDRNVNHRSPTTYIKRMLEHGDAVAERERIPLEQHAREIAAFGIRQIDGIDLGQINERVGYDFAASIAGQIEPYVQNGVLVRWQDHDRRRDHIQLTEHGLLFADAVEYAILE